MSNATSAFVSIDIRALATNPNYFNTLATTNGSSPAISLLSYDPSFESSVLGPTARARLVTDASPESPFMEAGVYDKTTNTIYISASPTANQEPTNITRLHLDDYTFSSSLVPGLYKSNGGTSYYPPGNNDTSQTPTHQVFGDLGDLTHYSALVSTNLARNTTEVILNNYRGRNFSGIDDVRQHPTTGDLWFTDSYYAYYQGFGPKPTIPSQIYRFEPSTGNVQAVADGFDQANGIEFSPDMKTLYVTDTGLLHVAYNQTRPATIYAYDIIDNKRLENRRLFAYTDMGAADGIHADTDGNVWVAAGDGLHVFNPEGMLLGKVFIGETSNNFAFVPNGVFVFSGARLWMVENIKAQGREVCKDFGVGCGKGNKVRSVNAQ